MKAILDRALCHTVFVCQDLSRLGRELSRVVIVDNSPASYTFHPDNAVSTQTFSLLDSLLLCQVGLVVNMSAFHAVGRRYVPQVGHTKDHHENCANCIPAWHTCVRV